MPRRERAVRAVVRQVDPAGRTTPVRNFRTIPLRTVRQSSRGRPGTTRAAVTV
ncbi:hypothetical protein [Streptomyces enissocaesilis]|uniref:hypothetical protein n=1 Tax=Streptomyces enissocaesilis TaxID=332589 RepID=UPI0031D75D8B